MKIQERLTLISGFVIAFCFCTLLPAGANGGPFVLKYPGGDPAAKGILARLDPNLKPAFETRLRVLREDLRIQYDRNVFINPESADPPLVGVTAEYTIENPTDEAISIDFGFPILRGIYMNPFSMMPKPDVEITLSGNPLPTNIISNSAIYGIIRQRARETIEAAFQADPHLQRWTSALRPPEQGGAEQARRALFAYLTQQRGWTQSDATLLVEFASLDLGQPKAFPYDRSPFFHFGEDEMNQLLSANLGPLAAIGEQKATQLFAQLAARFDLDAAATYEGIFEDWGGDVRERSIDLPSGRVRPREITVSNPAPNGAPFSALRSDPTLYARVDYLDPNATISDEEKASCEAILKHLPVIFTFAPMNLLHCSLTFPPGSTQVLSVSYKQFAFQDTRKPSSYQIAYVVHPAQHWKDFGPIYLEVALPEGIEPYASVPLKKSGVQMRKISTGFPGFGEKNEGPFDIHEAVFDRSYDEIFLAVSEKAWKEFCDEQIKEAKLEPAK